MSMQMRRNAIDDKTTISTVEISGSSDFSANTKCLHMIKKLRLLYLKKLFSLCGVHSVVILMP